MEFKVVEIFDSIDGEGIRTGLPVSFIRLAGCNLRCSYCDTLYALFGEDEPCNYETMSLSDILSRVNPTWKRITLTGGEPLIAPDVNALISALAEDGYEVNIETNGAVPIAPFLDSHADSVFFTIDYKLPSSGMEDRMCPENFTILREKDVIKFVVGSEEDIDVMLRVVKSIAPHYKKLPHIFVGAVFGQMQPARLVDLLMQEPLLKDARLQVQLHKIVWDPQMRGV